MKFVVINYMEPLPEQNKKEWRAHQIARIIEQKGYRIEYYTSNFDHFEKKYRTQSQSSRDYKINLLKATSYNENKSILRIISNLTFATSLLIKALSIKENIAWFISYPHGYGLLAIAIRKIIRKKDKFIVDIRDSPNLHGGGITKFIYNTLENSIIYTISGQVDLWVGAGENVWRYMKKNIQNKVKEKFIYLPMSGKGYKSDVKTKRNKDILFIGTLTDSFELEAVLRCIPKYPCRVLHVVGDGPLQEMLKKGYYMNKNIIFYGRKNVKEIIKISQECRYGILPYDRKSGRFNHHKTNKFAEYLSLGLEPIIHKDLGEMSDFCTKHDIGVVFKDFKELKKWWITEEKNIMTVEGQEKIRKIAEAKFSESACEVKIIQAIEYILKKV